MEILNNTNAELMDCEHSTCLDRKQRSSRFIVFRKTPLTLHFVNEWMAYSRDENLVDNDNRTRKADDYFFIQNQQRKISHQHIFSLLTKKWGVDSSNFKDILKSTKFKESKKQHILIEKVKTRNHRLNEQF